MVDGLVVIDKPAGPTSHDVVSRCRKIFSQRKVGHAGTLDPDATGTLLVGLGQATRLLRYFSSNAKRYTGEVVLGTATSTLDSSGSVTATYDMRGISEADAVRAAAALTGEIMQVPPMVSALKVGGRRLHDLARAGIEVERAPRAVTVSHFHLRLSAETEHGPILTIDVGCSAGTYVRSLAADLGAALGGGGHLRNLRRTASGAFGIEDAVGLEALARAPDPAKYVVAPADALRLAGFSTARPGPDLAAQVGHGKVLSIEVLRTAGAAGPGPWAILSPAGNLLAVYEPYRADEAKPVAVFATP